MASLVENIRVSRFVIDGFSVGGGGEATVDGGRCGSAGGAARPLLAKLSTLGMDSPLLFAGVVSGEPIMDEACEVFAELMLFSMVRVESRGPLTVAICLGW